MSLRTAYPNAPAVLHNEIALQPELSDAGIISRTDCFQRSESTTYNDGAVARIFLPAQMSDLRDSTLQFTFAGSANHQANIATLFQRVRVLIGTTPIVNLDQANLHAVYKEQAYRKNWETQWGALAQGFVPASSGFFAINLSEWLPMMNHVLPLQMLNEGFQLELTLGRGNDVLAAAGTYTITNLELHYSVLTMSQAWNNLWLDTMKNRGCVTISYENVTNFNDNSIALNSTNNSVALPFRVSSLLGIHGIHRTSGATDLRAWAGAVDFVSAVLKIDNVRYPSDQKNSVADCGNDWLHYINKKFSDDVKGLSTFNGASFVVAQYVAQHPKEQAEPVVPQGVDVSRANTSIVSEIQLDNAHAAFQSSYFARHIDILKINPSGSIQHFS